MRYQLRPLPERDSVDAVSAPATAVDGLVEETVWKGVGVRADPFSQVVEVHELDTTLTDAHDFEG